MKKIWGVVFTALFAGSVLTGCECKHENWIAANCTTPKTCSECKVIEGEALGHTWSEATCKSPKKCSVCQAVEGTVAGHSTTTGKCTGCNEYILDGVFIPGFNNFTDCLGVDEIPNDFTITSKNETANGFEVYASIPNENRIEGCKNLGWDISFSYTGTSDFHILDLMIINYVPENQNDLTELYDALVAKLTELNGNPNAGSNAWKEATGTLKLEIFKVNNAVSIAISMQ